MYVGPSTLVQERLVSRVQHGPGGRPVLAEQVVNVGRRFGLNGMLQMGVIRSEWLVKDGVAV